MTAEGSFSCRVPYRGEITVPPEHYFIFLTSNGVDTTRDFANRSNIVRIRKQSPDFVFAKFPEGDLLAHVRQQQAYYLGCVVAVMDGHQQAQERVSNPALVWLRNLVLAISEAGDLNRALIATDIHIICESADIAIPGLRSGADEDKAKKQIGMVMAKLFRDGNIVEADGFLVTREEKYVVRDKPCDGGNFTSKTYTVTKP
jgi:hypothetical protein